MRALAGIDASVFRCSTASVLACETATAPTLPTFVTGVAVLVSLAVTVRLFAVTVVWPPKRASVEPSTVAFESMTPTATRPPAPPRTSGLRVSVDVEVTWTAWPVAVSTAS